MDFVTSTGFLRGLYAGNMLWHTSAFIHFSLRPAYMMRKISLRSRSKDLAISSTPEGDTWHHDIMAYLGYINVGYATLAGIQLFRLFNPDSSATIMSEKDEALHLLALTTLGIANASQAYGNFGRARGSGRWIMGDGWDRITVLDAVFTVLDGVVVAALWWGW